MNKNYREIEFTCGCTIEDAVQELLYHKENGVLACETFNGTTLYSDTVTVDNAYKEIIGKTKDEFDKSQQQWRDSYDEQQREHRGQISSLCEDWIRKGREILSEDKWTKWAEVVPIRLADLYQGMELGCCLDIIKILNNNGTLDEAKKKIENQNHSGMSFWISLLYG